MSIVFPRREAEAHAFLDANPDITSIHVIWTDICGVARGKILRRDELVPAWKDGRFMPISALVLDITGQDVPETGLVFDEGDRDMLLWPVPGSLVRIPWMDEPTAQYLAYICDLDGTPHFADPRNALEAVVKRFQSELNMTPVGAVEVEFFLMDRASAIAGEPRAPKSLINEHRPQHYQAYYLQDLDDFAPFFKDLYAYCEAQGLPAKTLISEYAPGQMEIVLRHRADVLKACDEGIMLKRLIKATAEKHGMAATFMAKPYAQWTGSGMHIHVSLGDEKGNNLFAADDPLQNELLLHSIGGLKAAMAESMLIFAPNANSYRRFRRNSYAPVSASWGINNRTVSIRIPAGAANACHIEHRPSGADANPYLVMAAILAGMHYGITEKADPGNPVVGNGYEKRAKYIPGNWFDAIDAFWRASILKEYFGKPFVDTYCTVKEVEADRFYAEPTLRDFEWYLRAV
ncbi:MAG TPA: glutamine synthetase family protein [Aestuariivirga sp.]|jgi:glutamine synthetase|nr:glutamine synthetase [Hyphomicrobiales bacterium]MBP9173510.1 glutamine synthetase [Hyphomicrobiales bacterium]HQY73664.1 glutamine synthetase family protein [Aestuariivirga sp.]HRA93427.1 glutamine synthetase family protein [Aestuariivirga sp.]